MQWPLWRSGEGANRRRDEKVLETARFAKARQAQLACLERVCELLGAKVVLVDLQVRPAMASDGA